MEYKPMSRAAICFILFAFNVSVTSVLYFFFSMGSDLSAVYCGGSIALVLLTLSAFFSIADRSKNHVQQRGVDQGSRYDY